MASDKDKIDIAVGDKAASLLVNPDFNESILYLKADLLSKWSRTKDAESDKREELYKDVKALKRIVTYLESLADTAKMAKMTNDGELNE